MKLLIVEDEKPAARRIRQLAESYGEQVEVVAVLDSIESVVAWFSNMRRPDLMFLDIQLADGLSFDIFRRVDPGIPVIFTTAYDEYALKAFKLNSIDYLLKPIDQDELHAAMRRFEQLHTKPSYDPAMFEQILQNFNQPKYKERFTVKAGNALSFLESKDISYAYADEGVVFLVGRDGKKHLVDHKVEVLESQLDPNRFFRINRKMIVQLDAIGKIHPYFNSRLKLDLSPAFDEDAVVSRERCKAFKDWVG